MECMRLQLGFPFPIDAFDTQVQTTDQLQWMDG